MGLHTPSLLLANALVLGLSGALLLYSWSRGREERTLLWMGALLILAVPGIVMNTLRGMGFDYVPIVLGNMILLLCTTMNWTAVRVFCGRAAWWPGLLVVPSVWGLMCLWPLFYADVGLRLLTYSLLMVLSMLASISELLRSRSQLNVAIGPAMVLMVCHAGFYLARPFLDAGSPLGVTGSSHFFPLVVIESMLYAVGAGFVTLAMVKERAEAYYRVASLTDPLTQIGNRRAFTQDAQALLDRAPRNGRPLALMLADLDNFKQVNDRLGHPIGDWVLQRFATVLQARLGSGAVFGRIGGEEFACLLEGSAEQARALAEQIRSDFAAQVREHGVLSVSIGIACARPAALELSRLLSQADAALYEAKRGGRDRVVLAETPNPVLDADAVNPEQRRRFR